jgi:hypothetical protein
MKILFVSAESWDDIVSFQMGVIMVCQFSLEGGRVILCKIDYLETLFEKYDNLLSIQS